jgi:DNA-binding response OmpR family regulator
MSEGRRVLVVDDEALVTRMLETAFKQAGWSAFAAGSLAEASRLIASERFNAYVIDKNLPDGNGVDLIRQVREGSAAAVCVLITAYSSVESARETLRLDIDAYVEKPFDDITKITEQVAALCAQRRAVSPEPRTVDRPLKVVVATPDAAARQWLEARFRHYGDEVWCVATGAEALAKARVAKPDLVVADSALQEPDVAGLLRWTTCRAVAVLTTNAPLVREVISYIDLKVKAVIERPLDDDHFDLNMAGLLWRLRSRRD